MKKIFTILLLTGFTTIFAQQDPTKADECFKKANYTCAEAEYTVLANKELNNKLKTQFLNNLGTSQRRLGKTALAFKSYENAMKTSPDNILTYVNLSSLHSQKGDKQKALNYIASGLLIDDTNPDLYITRAKVYEDLGKKDLAEKDYLHLVSIAPDNYIAKTNYAFFKKNIGKLDEALKDYNTLISLKPESLLYNNRADVYLQMKKHKEAFADVNKAIAMDAKFSPAYVTKAKILFETGKIPDGCATLNQAMSAGYEKYLIADLLKKCEK